MRRQVSGRIYFWFSCGLHALGGSRPPSVPEEHELAGEQQQRPSGRQQLPESIGTPRFSFPSV